MIYDIMLHIVTRSKLEKFIHFFAFEVDVMG